MENLLKPGLTLDGRFLTFTGLAAEALRTAILAAKSDEAVLNWVEKKARPSSAGERRKWAEAIEAYPPAPDRAAARAQFYPRLAGRVDLASISVFDMIEMGEGRIPIPGGGE